ncbi:ArnT family glycosyltransferase [Thiomicrorhabdus sediminis]|uniref:Phospholipid carrier-dependent glycosyltransferase n=1 Tax=Thiomicrorhabdus sediminis TaxID=2580412 RepID=A0A4P9K8E6_9GAMM|nr:glycosyltransferase family 39 protein [Thiomicrorhabdus sediminis]QCU90676.1 phospholipid carrier-dependent glycosyltransferase [Thiomicrorhabdus sediminis]
MFTAFTSFISQLSRAQQILLAAFIVIKILLIALLPLTGDEAYFIGWGQNLSWGYYDHPPAVGWLLAAMSQVADNLYWYRAFAFFGAVLISVLIYQFVIMQMPDKKPVAFYTALVFFVSPISLMFVVTANDTVLVVVAVLGVFFFSRAYLYRKWLDAILAGLFLGLAFLAKYFAAFMLFGLLLFSLWQWRQFNWKQLAVMIALVVIALLENWLFNAAHCWNNILFNFFSRTAESHFDMMNVLSYLLMLLVLLSPLGVWYGLKALKLAPLININYANKLPALILFATLPLLLVLLVVSFKNSVGLHWPLIAVSLLYVFYARLNDRQLSRLLSFNAWLSLIAGVAILLALNWAEQLIGESQRHQVALYKTPAKVCSALPIDQQTSFFTLDYSSQSALAYHCQNDQIHVFASQSKYGREDDKLIDYKGLDGSTLKLLITHQKDLAKVEPYFTKLDVQSLQINAMTQYYWLEGHEFNYSLYREQVIKPVNEKFYTAPDWLQNLSPFAGPCPFKQRYDLP